MSTSVLPAPPMASAPPATPGSVVRNNAIDTYRGFVMFLMMAEVMEFGRVAQSYPNNLFWQIAGFNQSHVEWAGMSLHDMIQPSFSFLVGVALPYSIASRIRKGESFGKMLMHTMIRSLVLIALGVFLRSSHVLYTNYTFEDTLSQIGMGFTFLFLIYFAPPRMQWVILAAILFFYWLAWALYPAPGAGFDWKAVGVPDHWPHNFSGFAAHWNKNSNFGTWADQWFLNLFPRPKPFVFNGGGYLTSSFIPTLGTMVLGLIAGRWIKSAAPRIPFRNMLLTGISCLALAVVFHYTGICPIVKRIWTPSWTLFSGGVCFLFLSAFSWMVDVKQKARLFTPLIMIGRNSITAYLLADFFHDMFERALLTHLGETPFLALGPTLQPVMLGATLLSLYLLVLYWMYRRNIFLRI